MPPQETGKQRATRIPLDYYKHPDLLERWKLGLGAAALLLTTGWLAAGLLQSDGGRLRYSRGPVAAVHAAWEDNCTACHTPFKAISDQTWAAVIIGHASNERCQACHAGPTHHASLSEEPSCAACHRDHRGRDASLVRLPDSDCTQCHADLKEHRLQGSIPLVYANEITQFDTEHHPEFQAVKKDPGRLKFSHQVHMLPGLGTSFTLKQIADAGERERYEQTQPKGKAKPGDLVQLQCATCHRLDSGDFSINREDLSGLPAGALLPARSAGAYLLPITYENQCRACHPLTFERKDLANPLSGHRAVRHRLEPKEIHDYLEGHYTAQALQGKLKIFEEHVPRTPFPGKLLGKEAETVRARIRNNVQKAERLIFSDNTCGKCHYYQTANGRSAAELINKGALAGLHIQRTKVPDIWFEHAVFNHAAHRAVDCRACHPGAYALDENGKANPDASAKHTDVLVPGINNCVQCHAPHSKSGKQFLGGARFDCTECHRYHNGDKPGHGIGAKARDPAGQQRRGVARFLSGIGSGDQ